MDVTGAGGAISRSDNARMIKHAECYYEEIRRRSSDVKAIAKNTGFKVRDVKKIKRHIFLNYHELGAEEPLRFDPSYDMALSWQRLIDGKDIHEMDIVLLHHELYELELMAQGTDFDKAHELAETAYNYAKYINELDAKEGLF